jgi:hypothetical protein
MNQQAYFTSMGVWGDKKWEAKMEQHGSGFLKWKFQTQGQKLAAQKKKCPWRQETLDLAFNPPHQNQTRSNWNRIVYL